MDDLDPNLPARRTPLDEASAHAAAIDALIESGEVEPTEAFNRILGDTLADVSRALDRRSALATKRLLEARFARNYAASLEADARRAEALVEKLEASTAATIAANPKVPFRTSAGKKVSVCQNSAASLVLSGVSLGKPKTVSNVVDYDEAMRAGALAYVEPVQFYVLKTDRVREDLEAGVELSWARLERGVHLRGLVDREKLKELVR
jgi:hypothetical protein